MNRLFQVVIIATITCISTTTIAQDGAQEFLKEIQNNRLVMELEQEQSHLRWRQMEAEAARRHAEIEQLEMWKESQEKAERAEQAAEELAAAAKKAEEAADALRDEVEQAAVRTTNNIFLGILILLTAGCVTYLIRKSNSEKVMQDNQKFGIAVIIGTTLITFLAIIISDGWVYRFDFLQNLMTSLRIKLFESEFDYNDYYVNIPTKYVVLTCICVAAYGLTTYLGITPVPKMNTRKTDETDTHAAP